MNEVCSTSGLPQVVDAVEENISMPVPPACCSPAEVGRCTAIVTDGFYKRQKCKCTWHFNLTPLLKLEIVIGGLDLNKDQD